jgi:hypothetical protein
MTHEQELKQILKTVEGASMREKQMLADMLIYVSSTTLSSVTAFCANTDVEKVKKVRLVSMIIADIITYIHPLLKEVTDEYDYDFTGNGFAQDCGAIGKNEAIKVKPISDGQIQVAIGREVELPSEIRDLLNTMQTQPPVKA